MLRTAPLLAVLVFGCTGTVEDSDTAPTESDSVEDTGVELPAEVLLTVTLDGLPVEGAVVTQGGVDGSQLTDVNGQVTVAVDRTIDGEVALMASHPDARIRAQSGREAEQTIALVSFDRADNEDYVFDRPGTPGGGTTAQCGHCHVTMVEAWQASPHRTSASNPRLHDVYAGIAANLDATECADAGGSWAPGLTAGSLQTENRCYLGTGVLPDLNPTCTTDCETDPVANGACADCHAPGIDGVIGGRNLLEATGTSHDSGVHCDVCHKVESVDLDAPAGVGGRLHIVRPTEMTVTGLDPLTFGPFHDVPNPRMGAVQRDHFTSPELCAGCHQLKQEVLVPGESIDLTRWPDGVLPIHTTYDEFGTSSAACQDCHMPIDTTVGNSSDLGNLFDLVPGISAGWYRDDTVHEHAFFGPRQPDSGFLESAAGLAVTKTVDNGSLTAEVTVSSTRPPHAFPTGEPMRHLVLLVEARCGSEVLTATGGDVVPDYGGAIERKVGGDFSRWTDAQVGDVVRVVARLGGFVDYTGFGPFGDGRFAAGEKGLPIEQYVGEATVTSVDTGVASFDRALPQGEVAYLVRAQGLPTEGAAASGWAGAPGWAFARVLADADGNRMVPHHRAVDVVSDNRILAFQSWTSSHDFAATCADPEVEAVLLYRPYPYALSSERAWGMTERIAAQGVW